MPAGARQIASSTAGPGPSYFWTRITYNFNQSSGIWLTRELGFTSGSNFQGTRFTSSWYKRGTYAQLYSDPSSFTQNTTVCSLANISWGTTYEFGGGTPSSADTSTKFYCAAGYYSGAHSIATSTFYFRPWKVTFNINGGSWGANVRLNNADYTGSNYAIMAVRQAFYNDMSTDIPTRTGYTFKGWYTASSGGSQVYNASGKAVVDNVYWELSSDGTYAVWCYEGNVTLYAQWQAVTYTNSLPVYAWGMSGADAGSGSAWYLGGTNFTKKTGETFQLSASSSNVTIPNGFYLASSYGTSSVTGSWATYPFGTTITQKNGSMSFEYDCYANSYSITYNLNGGINSSSNPSSYSVLSGVTFANPTKYGYHFAGWYINDNKVTGINVGATNVFSSANDMYAKLASRTTGNLTVEARWERRNVAQHYIDTSTKKPVYADYYDSSTQTWKPLICYRYDGSKWVAILHVGQISVGQIGGGSGIG